MGARTIILISDDDGSGRIQLLEFADSHEAEAHLEQLLADGIPQESVRVFNAVEMQMQVSHRPVVSLSGAASNDAAASPEPAGATANSQVTDAEGLVQEEGVVEGEGEAPMIRDGVRFSSLFKPDGGLEPA